jgi:hypothetical protein
VLLNEGHWKHQLNSPSYIGPVGRSRWRHNGNSKRALNELANLAKLRQALLRSPKDCARPLVKVFMEGTQAHKHLSRCKKDVGAFPCSLRADGDGRQHGVRRGTARLQFGWQRIVKNHQHQTLASKNPYGQFVMKPS